MRGYSKSGVRSVGKTTKSANKWFKRNADLDLTTALGIEAYGYTNRFLDRVGCNHCWVNRSPCGME